MARPRTNGPADRFTTSEAAVVGAGLTARAVVAVQAIGFAPEPLSRAEGRSGSVAYDADGVAHWALIGALRLAGIPLLAAARLGYAVADELGAAYGRLPSGIDRYLGRSHNPGPRYFPWGNAPQDKFILIDRSRDFWLHHLLRTRTNIYKVGEVLDGDFCIEIVNSEYVFTGFHWKQPLAIKSPFGGASSYPSPEYRIIGWRRGSDEVHVRSILDEVGPGFADSDPDAMARGRAVEAEFSAARKSAVSLLWLNVSLAIRNAFDAIHDQRLHTGTKLDWNATAIPGPGRYDGYDLNGMPLDPAHPQNMNLSPLARAQRLVEIEQFVAERERQADKSRKVGATDERRSSD